LSREKSESATSASPRLIAADASNPSASILTGAASPTVSTAAVVCAQVDREGSASRRRNLIGGAVAGGRRRRGGRWSLERDVA
jgi:hypothetical protein